MNPESNHILAPELYGDFWFNSGPVSIRAMKGSIILLDFWDYSSVNCLRGLPYLKEWNRRYKEFGFMVIGVHTPKFKFGRNPENIELAIKQTGIDYSVVTDNDSLLWTSYATRSWPTKYLVDKDGYIRYSHQGEGEYEQLERAIQALLIEAGFRGELPDLMEPIRDTDQPGAVCFRPTGEIDLGYLRGTIGNTEGFSPEATIDYLDQGVYLPGRLYLRGKWFSEKEFIRFDGEAADQGSLTLTYEALESNVVMDNAERHSNNVLVLQDGHPLTPENSGADISFDEKGNSYIRVERPRMFNIIRNKEFGEHTLKLIVSSPALSLFSFSFVTAPIPSLISHN